MFEPLRLFRGFGKGLAVIAISLSASFGFATGTVEGGSNNTGSVSMGGPANSASSAKGAGDNQSGAQGAAIAMAAAMAAMCNQPQGNVAPCIMAAMAAMQAASLGDTSDGANQNAQQYSTSGFGGGGTTATTPNIPGAGASISGINQTLAKKGVTVSADGKSLTMADGSSVPLNSSSATDAGMKAAGLSDQQIAMGKQALAEAQAKIGDQKAKSGEMASDGTGGGGGAAAAAPSGGELKPLPRTKKSLSGLSKNFGNDKIGVAADNIFDMVSRRYKVKDAENSFIKN